MRIFNWMRNILTVIASVVIIAAVLCFALGLRPAIVMSGSMEPAMHVGSVAVIKQGASFAVGDPIAFYWGSEYVTHRLAGIEEENGVTYYITKGDANNTEDPQRLTEANIDGIVLFSVPFIGYILKFTSTRRGMMILGTVILCSIISLFMADGAGKEAGRWT